MEITRTAQHTDITCPRCGGHDIVDEYYDDLTTPLTVCQDCDQLFA